MREFCPTVIDTFHNQTDSALHLLNSLDILTVNVYQHNDLKVLHLQHKGLLKWIPSEIIFNMQVVFMDTTPEMLPNKNYVNQVCNNSGKQTVVYSGTNLYDKILQDML